MFVKRLRGSFVGVAATVECRGEQVAELVENRAYGATKVLRARSFLGMDEEDQQVTYLDLVLNDPPGATWPLDDLNVLRRSLVDFARQVELDTPLYVRIYPETDAPQEDDEPSLFSA